MSSRYVLKRRGDGKFTFTLQKHSGEVLLTSQVYNDKDSALRAIDTARRLAQREDNYELLRTDIGRIYFVLKNTRGEVIGKSREYIDAESSRQAINQAKANTRGARLEDLADEM